MQNMKNTAPYAPGNTASKEAADEIQHKLTGTTRRNSNNMNETVWLACASWPDQPYKPKKKPVVPDEPTGLYVFDDVFRRNPHLKSTFTVKEIEIIRTNLAKSGGK